MPVSAVRFSETITVAACILLLSGVGMHGPVAQFWLERTPDKREVIGSSPIRPTIHLTTTQHTASGGKHVL